MDVHGLKPNNDGPIVSLWSSAVVIALGIFVHPGFLMLLTITIPFLAVQ